MKPPLVEIVLDKHCGFTALTARGDSLWHPRDRLLGHAPVGVLKSYDERSFYQMNTNVTKAPLYVQFAQALRERCAELGIEPTAAGTETGLPQNEGYFFVEFGPHGQSAAIIVPKSKTRMGNVHLHIDASDLEGCVELPKKNGRVICHFVPDVDLLTPVLKRLAAHAVDHRDNRQRQVGRARLARSGDAEDPRLRRLDALEPPHLDLVRADQLAAAFLEIQPG